MKILLLTENWEPRVGGIERYLMGLVNELTRQGHEVTVIAPQVKSLKFKGKSYEKRKKLKVIRKRFYWPLMRPKWLPLLWHIIKLQQREKFELVLGGKALFEGLAANQLKKKTGVEYMVFTYAMEIEAWLKASKEKKQLQRVMKG